jgi:GNAT superfamily N-acetyltransferase
MPAYIIGAHAGPPVTARPTVRTIRFERADASGAVAIAALRNDAADRLTREYGQGPWSGHCSDRGVAGEMKRGAAVHVALDGGGTVIGTMTLGARKPWAIDPRRFSESRRPLYLTNMAVAPEWQRCGVGRACLAEAARLAREWPADALRLDAFDAPAGAGVFYAKCGFREVGRATYRLVPLIYYELLI